MADVAVLQPAADDLLRVAIAAHLARYKGLSRVHTRSDLQVFLRWCAEHELEPLRLRRSDVELFVRWLEEVCRFKPSTVARRLSVVTCFIAPVSSTHVTTMLDAGVSLRDVQIAARHLASSH
jgi:hypothetical protein